MKTTLAAFLFVSVACMFVACGQTEEKAKWPENAFSGSVKLTTSRAEKGAYPDGAFSASIKLEKLNAD